MVLKSEIEKVYHLQESLLKVKDKTVSRLYIQKLNPANKHIEVISGIRRCGKSTLMKQIVKKYYKNISDVYYLMDNKDQGDFFKSKSEVLE